MQHLSLFLTIASIVVGSEGGRLHNEGLKVRHVDGSKPKSLTSCGAKGSSAGGSKGAGNGTGIQIVNGEPAGECEWRWQVALMNEHGMPPWCAGMLIHKEWVLTAAHCASAPNFAITLGGHDRTVARETPMEQHRWAATVVQHPQYAEGPTRMDFSLVRLNEPVEINDCVGTVCLPTEGADVAAGSKCWITGWGTTSAGGSQPNVLQEVEVTTLSNEDCKNSGYNASDILDNMLCAQGRRENGSITDACQGDSGGPLVCEDGGRWTAYGATSWGKGCAGENYPGVWARIHEVIDWIDETIEVHSGPVPPGPAKCADFAKFEYPDREGDCRCRDGLKCSLGGEGGEWNCPTNNGGPGGWGGLFFTPGCEGCGCYEAPRCERPAGFCSEPGAVYMDTYDCDNDGIPDPYCLDAANWKSGFLASGYDCYNTWPQGQCWAAHQGAARNATSDVLHKHHLLKAHAA